MAQARLLDRRVIEEAANSAEDFRVHRWRQAAGLRVLLAGVINAEEAGSAGKLGFRAVPQDGSTRGTMVPRCLTMSNKRPRRFYRGER
jgi:hypothetical protein